jgi:hypothetical protein
MCMLCRDAPRVAITDVYPSFVIGAFALFVFRLLYLLSSTRYFYFLPEPTSHRTKLLGDKSVCPYRVCPGSPGVFLSVL